MPLHAFRYTIEYSCYAEALGHRYYWTNIYYFENGFGFAPDHAITNNLRLLTLNAVSEAVTLERFRIESAFGTGDWLTDTVLPTTGRVPGIGRNLLNNVCHVRAGQGVTGVWYKRLRGLLGAGDIAGGQLGSFIKNWLETNYVPLLAEIPLVNSNRESLGPVVVSSRVHPWTLRHGTYRRQRTVLGPVIE